jgi:enamine deaminase RidA (YjgF/YER057c/UK114 family)
MADVQYVNPAGACPAQGLYAHVARVPSGSLLFLAGQLSVGANGEIVGSGDFERQFQQVFQNLGDVLTGVGATFNHIAKFTTYLTNSDYIEGFMRARAVLFPKIFSTALYPPNTLLIVDRLVKKEFMIEVEAVAHQVDRRRE